MANLVNKTYKNPLWVNVAKTQLRVEVYSVFDDGTENTSRLITERSDDPGSEFQKILLKFDEEYINKNSETAIEKSKQIVKAREAEEKAVIEERRKRELQEKLFSTKLEAFEIEEVKTSTNRKLKAKIRKAKSLLEVQIFTTLVVMETINNENEPSIPENTVDVGQSVDPSSNESSGSTGDSQPTVEDFTS